MKIKIRDLPEEKLEEIERAVMECRLNAVGASSDYCACVSILSDLSVLVGDDYEDHYWIDSDGDMIQMDKNVIFRTHALYDDEWTINDETGNYHDADGNVIKAKAYVEMVAGLDNEMWEAVLDQEIKRAEKRTINLSCPMCDSTDLIMLKLDCQTVTLRCAECGVKFMLLITLFD